ncbi:MAG: hypothetical protein K8T89_22765 [Planctomycetes bacterium]|nr:hypothetical protein [Planctomycetota bacterium]
MPTPKKIATIVTEYRRTSHADVIVGKILEGYMYDGKEKPNLQVVSMFVDQVPKNDMSRNLAKKFDFKIADTIEEALTLGGKKIAVDGVVIVGEHGKYPTNEIGQLIYPRRRFFEETAKAFEKFKKSVPVFSDKHLGPVWSDAKWMYDRSRELFVPFLAGSSVPVSWRKPGLELPKDCELTGAVGLGYGPFEGYGFHTLEGLQCMVERRKGGETGVKAVTCLTGEEMWKALDDGKFSKECLEASIERAPTNDKKKYRELTLKSKSSGIFLIEYTDGLTAAAAMMNGLIIEGDGVGFCFGGKIKGEEKARDCQFYLQQPDPYGHFIHLVKAIDSLINTGHSPYPIERTLLTSGILDAVMNSKHQGGKRIETPHLAIKYTPTNWPFAPEPVCPAVKREF